MKIWIFGGQIENRRWRAGLFLLSWALCSALGQWAYGAGPKESPLGCKDWLVAPVFQAAFERDIPHTPTPLYEGEVEEAGEILSPGTLKSKLRDDLYVFLVTEDFDVILSSKFLLETRRDTQTGLVTHKSLLNKLESKLGHKPKIIGSGEFEILNASIRWISNRSGNFKGDEASLKASIQKMVGYGLPFKPNTTVRVLDANTTEFFGHTPASHSYDQFQLELRRWANETEFNRRLFFRYSEFYKVMAEVWPGEVAGEANLLSFLDYFTPIAVSSAHLNEMSAFLHPLSYISTADGLAFGLRQIHKQMSERSMTMVEDFFKLLKDHPTTSPKLKKRLEALLVED